MFFKIEEYEIELEVKSGLYIGGGDSNTRIGGVDNEFITHPNNNLPYIPGSSLKGKIRSLLEYDAGILSLRASKDKKNGKVLSAEDYEKCPEPEQKEKILKVLMLFGVAGDSDKDKIDAIAIARLSFSDLELTEEFSKDIDKVFETKAETAIDRKTGTAQNGSLRFTERVGKGVKFRGIISMKKFESDDNEELEKTLFRGIKLLEKDTLGGAGSRGYGRVSISFIDDNINKRFNEYIVD